MLQKEKRVKLYGKKLRQLNHEIFERDGYACIVCGRYVSENRKFHHEPNGQNKSDEITCGVVLCDQCHRLRHDSAQLKNIKAKCEMYLKKLYGGQEDG